MLPLRATSLKREIVLVTFWVRGAYICTLVAAVTAYLCGLDDEKWTEVTGAYSLTNTGFLNWRQYRDSGLCFNVDGRTWDLIMTGWYSMDRRKMHLHMTSLL